MVILIIMDCKSLMAVKKYWKISQVVMVITSEILNLSRVAGGHE